MHTSYSPDREYIDGVIVERSVGQGKHAYTQGEVVDPYERRAWTFEEDKPPVEVQDGVLRAQSLGVAVPLTEVLP
jgi:hypothetical protein